MARPTKGTPEWDLWIAAIEVAAYAPLRQGQYSYNANIAWDLIHQLRSAVETVGIDWREVKRRNEATR